MIADPLLHSELRDLLQTESVKHGHFRLAAGGESRFFIQAKLVTLSPRGLLLAAELLYAQLRWLPISAIGGKELGAVPLVAALSLRSAQLGVRGLPGFVLRAHRKDHGLNEELVCAYGLFTAPEAVAVIEDVTTTGAAALSVIAAVRAMGGQVHSVLTLIDRKQGAEAAIRACGVAFRAIYTADADGLLS